MATISITIPDDVATELANAFANQYGYNAATDGTKAQFAKKQLALFAKRTLLAERQRTAMETARSQTQTSTDAVAIT